ncbi:MAG TPA: serine/threonine-protein kinase [Candidatus Obscuribacterales bacterium]
MTTGRSERDSIGREDPQVGVKASANEQELPDAARDTVKLEESSGTRRVVRWDAQSLIGKTINLRYLIESIIGSGGMSVVFKATHLSMNKPVALKVLNPIYSCDPTSVRRFQLEAKAAGNLDHPNIVRVFDCDSTDDGHVFLVMDLLTGTSLAEEIRMRGPLSPERALNIFRQICAGLRHAHENGIIHRDLKPSNIMLGFDKGRKESAKIVDFGIAKLLPAHGTMGGGGQNLTQTGDIFGSPLYMSPEQCAGKELDVRSDIYSLGCVLYETLVGQPPFSGANPLETMYMHTNSPPPSVVSSSRGGAFYKRLDAIIQTCLQKDPDHRYRSAQQIEIDLNLVENTSARAWLFNSMASKSRLSDLIRARRLPFTAGAFASFACVLTVLLGAFAIDYWRLTGLEDNRTKSAETAAKWETVSNKARKDFAERIKLEMVAQVHLRGDPFTTVKENVDLGNLLWSVGSTSYAFKMWEAALNLYRQQLLEGSGDAVGLYRNLARAAFRLAEEDVPANYQTHFRRGREYVEQGLALCASLPSYANTKVQLLIIGGDAYLRHLQRAALSPGERTFFTERAELYCADAIELLQEVKKYASTALSLKNPQQTIALTEAHLGDIYRLDHQWLKARSRYLGSAASWDQCASQDEKKEDRLCYYSNAVRARFLAAICAESAGRIDEAQELYRSARMLSQKYELVNSELSAAIADRYDQFQLRHNPGEFFLHRYLRISY